MLPTFVAAIVLSLAATVVSNATPLRIGMMLDFDSLSGQGMRQAALMAASDLDQLVKIYSINTRCNESLGASAMEDLVAKNVKAVIGAYCSGTSLEAAVVANEKKVLLVSPSSSSPLLTTEGGKYFYRTIPSDSKQGEVLAAQIAKEEVKRLLVLTTDDVYGNGIADATIDSLANEGIETMKMVLTSVDEDVDLSFNPDAITFFGNDNYLLAEAMRNIILNQSFTGRKYGADSQYEQSFITACGEEVADGLLVTTPFRGQETFISDFRKFWSDSNYPPNYASLGYDAMKAIIRAYKDATYAGKSASPEDVANAMSSVTFLGAQGKVAFDENNDITEAIYNMFRRRGGSWSWV